MQGLRGVALLFVLALVCVPSLASAGQDSARWQGSVPAAAREARPWSELLSALRASGLSQGALAASSRMLVFFQDLPSKEAAYRAIVELIDEGYPGNLRGAFVPGDLEPSGDAAFAGSYNLYKYILNREKGMDRWAAQYYRKVDAERFPQYRFYAAVRAYAEGRLDEAGELLEKTLAQVSGEKGAGLARKVARTLARVRFEQKDYAGSFEIYQGFLLRMNPVQPGDWLEAAWNLYHLKRYDEALGLLYNLESHAGNDRILTEKYTLRALIYRQNCAVDNATAMALGFEREFGPVLRGLKQGESAGKYPVLGRIEIAGEVEYRQILHSLGALKAESKRVGELAPALRPLATYLYQSELRMLDKRRESLSDVLLTASAKSITVSENLKFLKYDVARERFNPDAVFGGDQNRAEEKPLAGPLDPFVVKWPGNGQYWRNERMSYRASVTRQCMN